jgi:iron complex transport system ATP-binding protein
MIPVVELRQVSFAYPRAEGRRTPAFGLSGVSLTVEPGEVVGVVGPNSAGKTTLLRLLTRVVSPAAGEILLEGRPLDTLARADIARRVAMVPQEAPRPFPFTVEELVLMGRHPHAPDRYFESDTDRVIAHQAMIATGVEALATLPLDELAGGERQRAMLARALAQEPSLLLLDEPTAHLDLRYQAEVAELLRTVNRDRGVTILLVSHDLALAADLADRLVLVGDGRVAGLGPPEAVLEPSLLEAVYRCPVIVEKSPVSNRLLVQIGWPSVERG